LPTSARWQTLAEVRAADPVAALQPLRLLILEDDRADVELLVAALGQAGWFLRHEVVGSPEQFRERLGHGTYDLILADHNLGAWTGSDALDILHETAVDIPLVVVTGSLGDEAAADYIQRGAAGYVLKEHLERLPAAIEQALRERAHARAAARLHGLIQRAKQEWEATFDALRDPVLVFDAQCRLQRANQAAAQLLGPAPRQLFGRLCHQILWSLADPLLECPCPLGPAEALAGARPQIILHGRTLDVAIAPFPHAHPAPLGCVLMLHDVTERTQAEEALRHANELLAALVQASPLAITVLDEEGNVRLWNAAAQRMFGWAEGEVLGGPIPFVPEHARTLYQAFLQRVRSGQALTGREAVAQKKNGAPLAINISAAPLRNAQGGICGAVCLLADLSVGGLTRAEGGRPLRQARAP